MALTLKDSWITEFIRDPVMAAYVIMGVEMDAFQAVRFRTKWFVPRVIDSSGVSVGKSEENFWLACLWSILLTNPPPYPGRIVSVYYQTLDVARDVFWEKWSKYIELSPLLRNQLLPTARGKWGSTSEGFLQMRFRNGNQVQCPAGDFINDSKNQASKRFTTLIVDEAPEIDKMGKGLNKQLLSRATAAVFNKNHPVWTNHVVLSGHAEDPGSHPFWARIKQYRKLIRDGSQRHALVTSCYADYSEKFAAHRPDEEVKENREILTLAEFRQQWWGLWVYGTKDWYPSKNMAECISKLIKPLMKAEPGEWLYVLGWDTAPGLTRKSDFNYGTVMGVRRVVLQPGESSRGYLRIPERGLFEVKPVYAVGSHGEGTDELAGVIHKLHQLFGFSMIVMDPGGGGAWIYKKLRENQQYIDGEWQTVRGLCTVDDTSEYPQADPVVALFSRGEFRLEHLWDARAMAGDEGIVESAHTEFSRAFETNSLRWTPREEDLDMSYVQSLTREEREVLTSLEHVYQQVGKVKVVVDSSDKPKMTARGFRRFSSTGKKDAAYSALYAYMGILAVLKNPEEAPFGEGEADAVDCIVSTGLEVAR